MTKKLLFCLLTCAVAFWANTGRAQSFEQTAQLLKAGFEASPTATVTQATMTQHDAEAVKEFETQIAVAKGLKSAERSSAGKEVNAIGEKAMTLLKQKFEPGSWQVTNVKGARRAAKAPSAMPDVFYAAEYDTQYSDGATVVSGVVTIKKVDDSHAVLYNLWGVPDTLQCTYDLAAGTVAITPGKIYDHSTYGPIWA